ncbi:MAG: NADH-quinone oxidoreductase subunit NuoF [Nitrospiraceae bacterium]|nr:MAG: NADH-quinone oxidoreductase subunit NuoF [Nitrospiraceae bacterium]
MDEIIFRNKNVPDSQNIEVYSGRGGYSALKKALSQAPDDIITMVERSGLRGRGGAGFPAGAKWRLLTKYRVKTVYLICNADEGEPGTFKDRYVMEFDPHLLLEGMTIAAYATSSHHGFIYIRGEYDWIAKLLVKAIEDAYAKGFIGSNIMGTDYSFYIDVFRGAGSYVCGEETGLIESLEGKAGRPRLKPPFPAAYGLYGEPTVIHNVSTLSYIPFIVQNGAAAYKAIGERMSGGTALFSISGHVNKPGLYEYPMGTSLRDLIYEAAGGIRGGRGLKAVIPGGLSSPVLRSNEIDVKMDYQLLNAAGTMFGSGGIIVLDEDTSIPGIALKAARFFAHESCGQCTPCREGTNMIRHLMERIMTGEGTPQNIEQMLRLCRHIRGSTICAFGVAATLPVEVMIRKFRSEFDAMLPGRPV